MLRSAGAGSTASWVALDDDHYALHFRRRRPGSNWSVVNVARFRELQAAGQAHASGLTAFDSRDRVVSKDVPAELDVSDLCRPFRPIRPPGPSSKANPRATADRRACMSAVRGPRRQDSAGSCGSSRSLGWRSA